jgi:hypothetical protein
MVKPEIVTTAYRLYEKVIYLRPDLHKGAAK